MKYIIMVLVLALSACGPGATPTPQATATSAPTLSPTETSTLAATPTPAATSTSAATSTATIIPSPTQTRTPTSIPKPTLPKFGPPNGVTFKYDDGVPPEERDFIQNAIAASQNVFGDAGTFTVFAYSDVNALMDLVAKNFNVSRSDPRVADGLYRGYQQTFDAGGLVTDAGIIWLSAIPAWRARSVPSKLSSLSFGYFNQARNKLAGTGAATNPWFDYGVLTWGQNAVLFKYGYADPVQFRREAIQRSRGVLNSLSTMEDEKKADSEDPNEKRFLGYLALDFLAANYGGEQAVFRKFWENYSKYPGWQLVFKGTFGLSLEEFYPKFEEYRRAQFPAQCGAVGSFSLPAPNAQLFLNFVRQDPPGALAFSAFSATANPPAAVAYTFCASGVQLTSLQDLNAALKLPAASLGWVSCGGNCVIVYMPQSASPNSYTLAIELPDKRRAEVQFQHSIPPAAVTPKP